LHTVFYLLGILKALGGVATFTPPTLYLESEEEVLGAQILAESDLPGQGPWVGMSPGAAYGPAKRWEPSRFAALGRELQRSSTRAWSSWGGRRAAGGRPGQGAASGPVAIWWADQPPAGPGSPVPTRPFGHQRLGVNARGRGALVPLVALFGSTDPGATGPFTSRATVIRHLQAVQPVLQAHLRRGLSLPGRHQRGRGCGGGPFLA